MKSWMSWIILLVIVHMLAVHSLLFVQGSRWEAEKPQTGNTSKDNNQPSCLKVSDFYSVHLTTYFLAAGGGGEADSDGKAKPYMQLCDRIPGTGKVIFTVDLMEQDARDMPVALSLSRYDAEGRLVPVKEQAPGLHPRGVLTLDSVITERGKYLLRVAFGGAKSKDDIIEMPVFAGL
ncbi:MAG: hypothetical protein L0Y57_02795 [Beijerinckiaceae bacterium]|nr:hypothetical protein [Beijerinckiaceae bacterium]